MVHPSESLLFPDLMDRVGQRAGYRDNIISGLMDLNNHSINKLVLHPIPPGGVLVEVEVDLFRVMPMDQDSLVGVRHLVVLDLIKEGSRGDRSIWIEKGQGRLYKLIIGCEEEQEGGV